MIFKIRSLVIVSLLAMLFSGVAYGENLLIGGINENPDTIAGLKAYATQIGATYVPTYTGSEVDNANEVRNAALDHPTVQNGLSLEELGANGPKHYDTIIAYSGGTASAVTALDKQGVTCDTLILISPMAAGVPDSYLVGTGVASAVEGTVTGAAAAVGAVAITGPAAPLTAPVAMVGGFALGAAGATTAMSGPAALIARSNYNAQINRILGGEDPAVKNIVVIQSPEDNLPVGYVYQHQFSEGANKQITVYNIELKSTGEDAHKELFAYAEKNLKADNNGNIIYLPDQPTLNKESNAFKKPEKPSLSALLGLSSPLLSPSTSGISWSSDQSNGGSDVSKTSDTSEKSGTLYTDKANDVWYVDALSWSGDRNLLPKPAAPYRFASGEINTYGYNWIYLPYSQTGITFTPGYGEWAVDTLASTGITVGAGVGPLEVGGGLGGGGGGSW